MSAYVILSVNPRYHLLLVLQYVHDYLQSRYIVCPRGMQSLNIKFAISSGLNLVGLSQSVLAELCSLGCVCGCEAWNG